MKKRAPIEVFSLSFLDVISCAFGAVVMLILLAKNGDEGDFNDASQISELVQALAAAEQSVSELQGAMSDQLNQLQRAAAESASNAEQADALEADIARAKNNVQQLTDQASGLQVTREDLQRASINVGKAKQRDEEVGGIPVDSDYVIFIIDTSGSMKDLWTKVLKTMNEVLNSHPQVKGFQVMSDNGEILGRSPAGSWRNDTPSQRRGVLAAMKRWNGSSSSSPVEGIEEALRIYAAKTSSLALYVFGDDYTGGSYDTTLERINKLNTNKRTGKKIARIHGVGFKPRGTNINGNALKFSTLMREVAKQNNGTFLAP
ncbi:hypothetical protein [Alteromonas sp. a30]|uniref:hypothetical protein n=1 Tax=Alteromonas sp. a30 TaxID=2730917 RepID=UPI002280A445|nr:hypothetical protein [Alteromonas sp. a30]MCY7296904.1 hypothetical protein [Alteromonas sp. a30]